MRFSSADELALRMANVSTGGQTMYDVAIAGGGPAGLNAGLVLGRARRRTLLCDTGRPRNAVSPAMHGFLTRDGDDPAEVRRIGREQLAQYDTTDVRKDEVVRADRGEGGFTLSLGSGERITTRRLMIATGMRDELPPIDGLRALWGRGTFPCPYCDGWELRDQPLFAVGTGTDGALFALLLSKWSGDVLLCTDGPSQLDEEARSLLNSRGVHLREDALARVEGDAGAVEVVFEGGERLRRRALFVHPTLRQASELPTQLGCAMTDEGAIHVSAFGQTSVPGVYAAGDAARPEGLPFPAAQVVVAAGAGAIAAIALDRDLLVEDLGLPAAALA
jgi:thioredoxin reductase